MSVAYTIRAGSRNALLDMLEAAQAGRAQSFVFTDGAGERRVDESRVRIPYEEMTEAALDGMTGEAVAPAVPTGFWLCVVNTEGPDAEIAAMAGV